MSNTSSTSSNGASNRSTTSTPVSSQPRPPNSTAASSQFDFLFGPSGGAVTSTVQTPPQSEQKVFETGSDASKLDKGKAVARNQSEEDASASEPDAIQRQIQVDKILKRAEAAKLARAFRNRLALASFKTSRGWQDVTMDVIEPHLRDEALKRQSNSPLDSQHSNDSSSALPPSRPASTSQSPFPVPPTPQPTVTVPPTPPAADQPYQYQINYNARPMDLDAVISGSGGGSAHKRNRSIDPTYGGHGSPYGSQASPYSTSNVYRTAKTQESPTKRRMTGETGTTPRQRQKSAGGGGSKRNTPLRQSTNGTPAKPPSSTDPAFSSFVDAAAALTGMARHPSDPSMSGSEEELHQPRPFDPPYLNQPRSQPRLSASLPAGSVIQSIPHPPHHHHAFPQPQSCVQSHPFPGHSSSMNGHPSQNFLYESLPLPSDPTTQPPPRPATPEKAKANGGGAVGSGENSEVAAADLMLFLAHSPSPVQTRKPQSTLGDGSGIKGRRLFGAGDPDGGNDEPSGSGGPANGSGLAQSVFGGTGTSAFSPSQAPSLSRTASTSSPFMTSSSGPSISTSRALDKPFDPTSSTSSAPLSLDAEPSKPSSAQFLPSSSLAPSAPLGLESSALSDPHLAFPAPGTPRQRQPSFNGQGWESFINASPSPSRATIPRGDTPPGLGGNVGGDQGEATAV